MLVQEGMVNQIAVSSSPDRYDYIHNREKHGHVICKKCGQMYDFFYDFDFEKAKASIAKQTGFDICEEEIMVKGICNLCKKAQD